MVKILANGDIVHDNDPRVNSNQPKARRQGYIQHNEEEDEGYQDGGQGHAQHGNQASVFDGLNQRLLDMGIPSWNLGEHVIEPIVTVGFLLAFLLLGFRGILFAALLFGVNKMSQRPGGLSGLFQSFTGGRGNAGRGGQRRGPGGGPNRRGPGGGSNRTGPGGGPNRRGPGGGPNRTGPGNSSSPPGGNRLGGNKLGSS